MRVFFSREIASCAKISLRKHFLLVFFVYLAKLSAETRNLSRKLKKILMPAIGLTVLGSLIYAVELVCTDMHEQNLERLL